MNFTRNTLVHFPDVSFVCEALRGGNLFQNKKETFVEHIKHDVMINNNDVNFVGNYQCLSNFVSSPSVSKVLSFLIQRESLTSQWILSPTLTTNPKMFYIMFPLAKRICYRIVHFASSCFWKIQQHVLVQSVTSLSDSHSFHTWYSN